jgi:hypothetical protein
MRRHRLRFGGGDTGSLGGEGEPGFDATVGDKALVEEDLVYSDSGPEAVTGGAPDEGLLRECAVGGDSVLCAAVSRPCSCSIPESTLVASLSSARALPPVCSSRSSMFLRPSRLVRRERWNTDWVGEGKNKVVGKSQESIVPCRTSVGCLRRSSRWASGGRSPAGSNQDSG